MSTRTKFTTETAPTFRLDDCLISDQARRNQMRLNVTPAELLAAVESPEEQFWSEKHKAWTHRAGRIAVGIHAGGIGGFPYITAVLTRNPPKAAPEAPAEATPAAAAA